MTHPPGRANDRVSADGAIGTGGAAEALGTKEPPDIMGLPMVAIVGRPNTGKSTLFNRLVGRKQAVVSDREKTTRDRIYGEVEWGKARFFLVDTGGLLPDREATDLDRLVARQVRAAAGEADLVLFLVDGKTGPLETDLELAREFRRLRNGFVVVVNKEDAMPDPSLVHEFLGLGLGEPLSISAAHGTGVADLLDEIVRRLPEETGPPAEAETVRIGIVGRPNVGKSSLVNAYLRQERMVVSEEPGTTRDTVDSAILWKGKSITLVDTAGLRRRSRVHDDVEYFSMLRALRAIEASDIVFLLIDAAEPIGKQDAHIASVADRLGRGAVVLINKTDLPLEQPVDELKADVAHRMPFLAYAPVLAVSALTRKGIGKALDLALAIDEERKRKLATSELNKIVEWAAERNPPPVGRRPNKIYYAVQTAVAPPTFLFFVKESGAITPEYRRYLVRSIREKVPFEGTPVVVHMREKSR
ncbi:MAG: ribosome biogenesis GTPase Der [Candidatus Eisenbacteria bacterium]